MLQNSSSEHGVSSLICRRADLFLLARSSFGVMDLLHRIHPAVGLSQQALYIESVFRTKRHAYAEGNQFASADVTAGIDCGLVQSLGLLLGCFWSESRGGDDEFVAAHAGHVVVAAADIFQPGGEFAQK